MLLRGCIDPSLQISTPGDRTPVAPVPPICHRPGAVRACVQCAHGVADYHLFSMWRCWPFATLLANAPERCARCADRERHRESRPRGERMRVSIAIRRGVVRVRCGEAFAHRRPLPHTAAIVERESPFQASLSSVEFGADLGQSKTPELIATKNWRLRAPTCADAHQNVPPRSRLPLVLMRIEEVRFICKLPRPEHIRRVCASQWLQVGYDAWLASPLQ